MPQVHALVPFPHYYPAAKNKICHRRAARTATTPLPRLGRCRPRSSCATSTAGRHGPAANALHSLCTSSLGKHGYLVLPTRGNGAVRRPAAQTQRAGGVDAARPQLHRAAGANLHHLFDALSFWGGRGGGASTANWVAHCCPGHPTPWGLRVHPAQGAPRPPVRPQMLVVRVRVPWAGGLPSEVFVWTRRRGVRPAVQNHRHQHGSTR
jgi:hypothetical protein